MENETTESRKRFQAPNGNSDFESRGTRINNHPADFKDNLRNCNSTQWPEDSPSSDSITTPCIVDRTQSCYTPMMNYFSPEIPSIPSTPTLSSPLSPRSPTPSSDCSSRKRKNPSSSTNDAPKRKGRKRGDFDVSSPVPKSPVMSPISSLPSSPQVPRTPPAQQYFTPIQLTGIAAMLPDIEPNVLQSLAPQDLTVDSPTRSTKPTAVQRNLIPKSLKPESTKIIVGRDGAMYNDRGFKVCGVLNKYKIPCSRVGYCPFHKQKNVERGTPESIEHHAENGEEFVNRRVPRENIRGGDGEPIEGISLSDIEAEVRRMPQRQVWTKEEQYRFLIGLEEHGRGNWFQIAQVVGTRNAAQVQSHAQKYYERLQSPYKKKYSIYDLKLPDSYKPKVAESEDQKVMKTINNLEYLQQLTQENNSNMLMTSTTLQPISTENHHSPSENSNFTPFVTSPSLPIQSARVVPDCSSSILETGQEITSHSPIFIVPSTPAKHSTYFDFPPATPPSYSSTPMPSTPNNQFDYLPRSTPSMSYDSLDAYLMTPSKPTAHSTPPTPYVDENMFSGNNNKTSFECAEQPHYTDTQSFEVPFSPLPPTQRAHQSTSILPFMPESPFKANFFDCEHSIESHPMLDYPSSPLPSPMFVHLTDPALPRVRSTSASIGRLAYPVDENSPH